MTIYPNRIFKTNDDRWHMTLYFRNKEIYLRKNSKDEPIFGQEIAFDGRWDLEDKKAQKLYDLLHLEKILAKAKPKAPYDFFFEYEEGINWREVNAIV